MKFKFHAANLIRMLDETLNLLGPDIDLLTEIMTKLGYQHLKCGVTADMFPLMNASLIEAVEDSLKGGSLSKKHRKAWIETMDALTEDMVVVQVQPKN